MSKNIFTTTAGLEVPIQPINMLDLQLAQDAVEREFRERGEKLDIPKYKVDVFGGEVEYHEHTEETIAEASEQEKEEWQVYQETQVRLGEATEARTALVFLEGIQIELPEDDKWAKRRQRLFGETIPDDPEQRLLYYVNNVVLKTPADKQGIMESIYLLSMRGAGEEAEEAFKKLFRSQMEFAQRQAIGNIEALSQEKTENVVLQSTNEGRDNSQVETDVTETVSQS